MYSTTSPGQCAGSVVGPGRGTLDSNRCTGYPSTSTDIQNSPSYLSDLLQPVTSARSSRSVDPLRLQTQRLVPNSAGALSPSQRQQCGITHCLPNKDSAVPYRFPTRVCYVLQELYAYVNRTTRDAIVMSQQSHNGSVVTEYVSILHTPLTLLLHVCACGHVVAQRQSV